MRQPSPCQEFAQQFIDKFHLTPQKMWNLVTRGTKSCFTPNHNLRSELAEAIREHLRPYSIQLFFDIVVSSDVDLQHYRDLPPMSTYRTMRDYVLDMACIALIEKIGQMLPREELTRTAVLV